MTNEELIAPSAVFLDRDGLLIEYVPYLSTPEQVQLRREIVPFLRQCTQDGIPLVVVSNQSGVGRGLFDEEQLEKVTERIIELLKVEDVIIARFFHCTAAPDGDEPKWKPTDLRRKPNPGMFLEAQKALGIDLGRSIVLGDRVADGVAGQRAGLSRALLVNDKSKYAHEFEELESVCEELKMSQDFFQVFADLSSLAESLQKV